MSDHRDNQPQPNGHGPRPGSEQPVLPNGAASPLPLRVPRQPATLHNGPWLPPTDLHDPMQAMQWAVWQAEGLPAPALLCGHADGTLRQVAPPLAQRVQAVATHSALCRLELSRWWQVLTPLERLRALWRQVPLRARAVLAVLLVVAAYATAEHMSTRAIRRAAWPWTLNETNGLHYYVGGRYDHLAEARRHGRRQGMRPLVFSDQAELDWLKRRKLGAASLIYLGYHVVGTPGNWQTWTGEPVKSNLLPWAPGEPSRNSPGTVLAWDKAKQGLVALPPPNAASSVYVMWERKRDPEVKTWDERYVAPALFLLAVLLAVNIYLVLQARLRLRGADWDALWGLPPRSSG